MRNAWLDEAQAGIKIARRNINNFRYADDTAFMAESEEELKSLLITSRQSRFDAQYWMLGAGALGRPKGRVWGGKREEGSGWGARVYLCQIHFDV